MASLKKLTNIITASILLGSFVRSDDADSEVVDPFEQYTTPLWSSYEKYGQIISRPI